MVQKSDATQVEDEARVPQHTIRVVWPPTSENFRKVTESAVAKNESVKTASPEADYPRMGEKDGPLQSPQRAIEPIPTSEVSTEVMEISALARSESVKATDPEADPPTTSDKESPLWQPERTINPLRTTPLALLVFLALGLPAAGVLVWLVMESDGASDEQIARKHLELNAAENWKYNNKHRSDVLDDQRDQWIDKLLSDQVQSAKASLRSSTNESVPSGREAIEAALRQFALRHRAAPGYIGRGGLLSGSKPQYEWPKLVPGKTARTKESYGSDDVRLRGDFRNYS